MSAGQQGVWAATPVVDVGEAPNARVRLSGHESLPAWLEVERLGVVRWTSRVAVRAVLWIVSSVLTVVLTFDPFVASFPFVIGLGLVYRGIVCRYRVRAFTGACPRCRQALRVEPGSTIGVPHPVDCYGCHFQPELHVGVR
jgi:hypothetical protein